MVWAVTIWFLWGWRNECVFTTNFRPPNNPYQSVLGFIRNYMSVGKVNARSIEVEKMRGDHPQAWRKLEAGWIKLNFDGLMNLENGEAQCRGLLRDYQGRWMRGYAKALGTANPWEVEAWGFKRS